VVLTVASTGEGLDELVDAVERHHVRLEDSGELARRRTGRLRAEVEAIVVEKAAERARQALARGTIAAEVDGDLSAVDPYALADRILNGHQPDSLSP